MDIRITPTFLHGKVSVPPSKSISHRAMICAALSGGESVLRDVLDCEDTRATADALRVAEAAAKANIAWAITGEGGAVLDCNPVYRRTAVK